MRGLDGRRGEQIAAEVEKSLRRVKGVRWAQVNPVLAAVAVSFEDGRVDPSALGEIIGSVEEAHGADGEAGQDVAEHPADTGPINRAVTALVADVVGIGVGVVARAVRVPALPVELASSLTSLDGVPQVRRALDRHHTLSTGAAVASAALQGLGQGPLGLAVDAAHRVSVVGELSARRRAWLDAEEVLCGHGTPAREILPATRLDTDRPEPLPASLAERYAQASSLVSLAAAALTLGITANPVRTADVLLAGVPRAARYGVESFATTLGRELAARGAIVTEPAVLRRLDLVDTVVVDAPTAALTGPELYEAIRDAAQDLVIAGRSSKLAEEVGADLSVAGGTALTRSIRRLQAEGRVVALVSHRAGAALRAADLGIGILPDTAEGASPPWGADVICRDPAVAVTVVRATKAARAAARASARLAAGGSVAGGIAALGPLPGAGRRAVTAVQLSALAAMAAGAWSAAKVAQLAPPKGSGSGERPPLPTSSWHAMESDEVLAEIGSSADGLGVEEAARRQPADGDGGPSRPSVASLVTRELTNPLTAVLAAGAALSAATGSVVDAALIGGVIGLDATIGVAQRLRTEAAITSLGRAVRAGRTRIVRPDSGGRIVEADARQLVPGDVIDLHAGDAVPADARLLDAVGVEADESALTGESLPVAKGTSPVDAEAPLAERSAMLYAGTAVAAGRARAVVVATGRDTEARRAAGAATDKPATGVEARLKTLTSRTIPVVAVAGAGLTLNGLLRGAPAQEAVSSGVSLAASAVPEGLPFVAGVAQAAAAHRLARSDVLVRNPHVLEALGRVDVLCFDKTGTLTEGKLHLTCISDGHVDAPVDRLAPEHKAVLAAALRATPRARAGGLPHPTDQAVVDGAHRAGVGIGDGVPGWKKTAALPFEPGRGYHAVAARSRAGMRISVKGAPEVVLPRCRRWRQDDGQFVALGDRVRERVERDVDRLARRGLRVLAVAERNGRREIDLRDEDIDDLDFYGFVGVADEARSGAEAPLRSLREAGIRVAMITGDHPSTAEAVASALGLDCTGVVTGPEIDRLDDAELASLVEQVSVFARVAPAHKVRIVAAMQASGRAVAMTGDGANDAQAIQLASVGIAFGSRSTPAAQAAADIVIARDDLEALIETMVEGRAMWASVRDALSILLGGNLGEVLFAVGGALVAGRPPLGARQLLTVNLFTDLVPAMAIAVQPPRSGRVHLEREGPETSLSGRLARDVAIRAGATAAGAYGAWIAARLTGTPARARTVALAALVGSQLGQTLVVGRHSPVVVGSTLLSAAGLVAVIQTPGLNNFFGCRPLGPAGWGIAVAASAAATAGAAVADALIA